MSQDAVEKFLKSLDEDEGLRKKFTAAVAEDERSPAAVAGFANKNGFDFTEEDLENASKSVSAAEPEALSDKDLEAVAGGIIVVGGSFSTSLLRSLVSYKIPTKLYE